MEHNREYQKYQEYKCRIKANNYHNTSNQYHDKMKQSGDSVNYRYINVPEIIGKNNSETFLDYIVDFPAQFPAIKVLNNLSEIKDLTTSILKNKVIVDGLLSKTFTYQTFEGLCPYGYNKTKYHGIYGSIRYISIDLSFSCLIDIPDALPDDSVNVLFSETDDTLKYFSLEECTLCNSGRIKQFKKLNGKDIVRIEVEVSRLTKMKLK